MDSYLRLLFPLAALLVPSPVGGPLAAAAPPSPSDADVTALLPPATPSVDEALAPLDDDEPTEPSSLSPPEAPRLEDFLLSPPVEGFPASFFPPVAALLEDGSK